MAKSEAELFFFGTQSGLLEPRLLDSEPKLAAFLSWPSSLSKRIPDVELKNDMLWMYNPNWVVCLLIYINNNNNNNNNN